VEFTHLVFQLYYQHYGVVTSEWAVLSKRPNLHYLFFLAYIHYGTYAFRYIYLLFFIYFQFINVGRSFMKYSL
jgi:hypothetical protein